MSEVNKTQIGGDHYKGGTFQHWDMMVQGLQNRYLEGCATKYIFRWRDKDGLQDLDKALHYIQKLHESFLRGLVFPIEGEQNKQHAMRCAVEFVKSHSVPAWEASLIIGLATWSCAENLQKIADGLTHLMQQNKTFLSQKQLRDLAEFERSAMEYSAQWVAVDHVGTPVHRNFVFEGTGNGFVEWQCCACRSHVRSARLDNGRVKTPICKTCAPGVAQAH